MQQIRASPTGPVIYRDLAQAEIEYEQLRQLCDDARGLMLIAALDITVPSEFWRASLAVLKELELYTEHLRKVPRDLIRLGILQYYGLPRAGETGDSGIVTESNSDGVTISPPDLLSPVFDTYDDSSDSP